MLMLVLELALVLELKLESWSYQPMNILPLPFTHPNFEIQSLSTMTFKLYSCPSQIANFKLPRF